MKTLHKDFFIVFLFIAGMAGFFSGEFIISSALFAGAAVASNVQWTREKKVG